MLPVGLILLAAGGSRRLGTPKQLARDGAGTTLLRGAAQTALASSCHPIVVVLGAAAETLRQEIADLPVTCIVNSAWAAGIGSSLRAGLAAVTTEAEIDAVIVMLCDQPLVSTLLLDSLVAARQSAGHEIAACEYSGVLGVPALFGRSLFSALAALDGDEGARKIIRGYDGPLTHIPFPDGLADVDTLADLNGLRAVQAAASTPEPS